MSNDTQTISKRSSVPTDKPFIVQCTGYRCMAYRDSHGQWRDYFNGEVIQGEVTIIVEG